MFSRVGLRFCKNWQHHGKVSHKSLECRNKQKIKLDADLAKSSKDEIRFYLNDYKHQDQSLVHLK